MNVKIVLIILFIQLVSIDNLICQSKIDNRQRKTDSICENCNFYPLHVGDKWFYKWTYAEGDSDFVLKSVLGMKILKNNLDYFTVQFQSYKDRKRKIPISNYFRYQRIDSLGQLVLWYDSTQAFPHEIKYYNLAANVKDTIWMYPNSFPVICTNIFTGTIFSRPVTAKSFWLPNTYSSYSIADGIGEYGFTTGEDHTNESILISAKIDGHYMGDSLTISSINEINNKDIPTTFSLSQNYPNPFNPSTTINYTVASAGNVTLKVYDMLGREVATLVNEYKQPGSYQVNFNTSHASTSLSMTSGIYFYRLQCGSFSETKKFVLMK